MTNWNNSPTPAMAARASTVIPTELSNPSLGYDESARPPQDVLQVNGEEPTTSLQIRLGDGTRQVIDMHGYNLPF
jgi:hypothetical protein